MTDTPEKPEEPQLPSFMQNPQRADVILMVLFAGIVIYGFALIPFRAYLLSHPLAYNFLVGGYTSAVVSGANVAEGNGRWWVYLLANLVGAIKFIPVYWWMGRRWGQDFIDLSVQFMPRVRKALKRILVNESLRTKAITAAFVPLGFLPGPVPSNIVNAVLGLLKVPLLVVLLINGLSILAINGTFMWLGHQYDQQVLSVVEVVNRYLLWITLGLLAVVFFRAYQQGKKARP